MKIAFTCDTMGSGGAERVISTLSNFFVEHENEVTIVVVSTSNTKSFYELDKRVKVVSVLKPGEDTHLFKRAKQLKKMLSDEKPDVVVSFLSHICIYTWWALKNTTIPYIVSERNDPNQHSRLRKVLLKKAYKRSAGAVFQTEDAMRWYGNIVNGKSCVILNPANLSFEPKGIINRSNKIIYVGRLEPQKNCFFLIDAFIKFNKNNPDYVLEIYGSGSQKEELANYIDKNGMSNLIHLNSPNKNWHEKEYDAKMFVLTSKFEGMPNALEEALCLGIPSVSTDCPVGGPRELKKLFNNLLYLAEPNNVDNFVLKMEECLTNKNDRASVPNELLPSTISGQWLSFISRSIKKWRKCFLLPR